MDLTPMPSIKFIVESVWFIVSFKVNSGKVKNNHLLDFTIYYKLLTINNKLIGRWRWLF